MWMVNKKEGMAVNCNHIVDMYLAECDVIAMVRATAKNTVRIGRYETREQAKEALLMITHRLAKWHNAVIPVPEDEEVQTSLIDHDRPWHHATGKKTKGHGGS